MTEKSNPLLLLLFSGDDKYYWIDGSEVVWENWGPGEPNDEDGTETCVQAYGAHYHPSEWSDHRCFDYRGHVCETQKGRLLTLF